MGSARLAAPAGSYLDRTRRCPSPSTGARCAGFQGDTLASALLANGVRLVGRSFKLHRPRGIWSCGAEEPSALVDVGAGARRTPNVRATLLPIAEGLNAVSVNCWPGVGLDLGALTGAFAALLPAGFYYKTFKWPSWQLFEPAIRRMAGLGRAPRERDADHYEEVAVATDVLVVGAGIAGLTAAVASAEGGARTMLLAAGPQLGGTLGWQGDPALATLARRARECGVRILTRTVAFGIYDHNLVCACESVSTEGDAALPAGVLRERLWKIRARAVIAATGALERPLLFPDNDRPGVMLAGAAARYAGAFGVRCGERVVIAANSDHAYTVAAALAAAGVEIVAIAERRQAPAGAAPPPGTTLLVNAALSGVRGGRSVRGCTVTELASGRARPLRLRPHSQRRRARARGAPAFPGRRTAALARPTAPCSCPTGSAGALWSVGACAGVFDREAAATHAAEVGHALGRAQPPPACAPCGGAGVSPAHTAVPGVRGKQFVDLQNDVCAGDVALAARENYRSVEHLKRYTTTGMGTDQGKTSNINALVLMGEYTQQAPPQVGTTRFRPPFVPVTLGALAGRRVGALYRPLKRLPAHAWHAAHGALFEIFGDWSRPAAYPLPGESLEAAAQREAAGVRAARGTPRRFAAGQARGVRARCGAVPGSDVRGHHVDARRRPGALRSAAERTRHRGR